jgi:hypothetical protein
MASHKSVRRDAERGGRDDRAPRTAASQRFNRKYIMYKDADGGGAGRNMRGRMCSPVE